MLNSDLSPLYLITDPLLSKGSARQSLFEVLEAALDEGVGLIQYREKTEVRCKMFETAKRLREMTARYDATFIVNDEIDLALAVKADGVHLGQDDLPVWVARKVLGKEAIIGISTHHWSEAIQAESDGADYVGIGPIFSTPTKRSSGPPLGITMITEVREKVRLPIFAIGGIKISHISEIMAAGADGVAMVSAIAGDVRSNVNKAMSLLRSF
ncbi:MAG: thiamine phosphate synthase [Nitrospira sp.]|nr:thiamine phosphate synthase [Candidatus Manganitrophaceae bacterium]HIL34277.1 thiamine phosphate synthase [Candidatus Manganitrophaceae bacterium]